MGAKLKSYFSRGFFKSILFMTLYFAVSVLVLHDVFIIISQTFMPNIVESATPYILDKLLNALLATIAA